MTSKTLILRQSSYIASSRKSLYVSAVILFMLSSTVIAMEFYRIRFAHSQSFRWTQPSNLIVIPQRKPSPAQSLEELDRRVRVGSGLNELPTMDDEPGLFDKILTEQMKDWDLTDTDFENLSKLDDRDRVSRLRADRGENPRVGGGAPVHVASKAEKRTFVNSGAGSGEEDEENFGDGHRESVGGAHAESIAETVTETHEDVDAQMDDYLAASENDDAVRSVALQDTAAVVNQGDVGIDAEFSLSNDQVEGEEDDQAAHTPSQDGHGNDQHELDLGKTLPDAIDFAPESIDALSLDDTRLIDVLGSQVNKVTTDLPPSSSQVESQHEVNDPEVNDPLEELSDETEQAFTDEQEEQLFANEKDDPSLTTDTEELSFTNDQEQQSLMIDEEDLSFANEQEQTSSTNDEDELFPDVEEPTNDVEEPRSTNALPPMESSISASTQHIATLPPAQLPCDSVRDMEECQGNIHGCIWKSARRTKGFYCEESTEKTSPADSVETTTPAPKSPCRKLRTRVSCGKAVVCYWKYPSKYRYGSFCYTKSPEEILEDAEAARQSAEAARQEAAAQEDDEMEVDESETDSVADMDEQDPKEPNSQKSRSKCRGYRSKSSCGKIYGCSWMSKSKRKYGPYCYTAEDDFVELSEADLLESEQVVGEEDEGADNLNDWAAASRPEEPVVPTPPPTKSPCRNQKSKRACGEHPICFWKSSTLKLGRLCYTRPLEEREALMAQMREEELVNQSEENRSRGDNARDEDYASDGEARSEEADQQLVNNDEEDEMTEQRDDESWDKDEGIDASVTDERAPDDETLTDDDLVSDEVSCRELKSRSSCDARETCKWRYPKSRKYGKYCYDRPAKDEDEGEEDEAVDAPQEQGGSNKVVFQRITQGQMKPAFGRKDVDLKFGEPVDDSQTREAFQWSRHASDHRCSRHDECVSKVKLENMLVDYGKTRMSYSTMDCCMRHPTIRIMAHAVADYFQSIGFYDWWVSDELLDAMSLYNGKMPSWTKVGTIRFAVGSGSAYTMQTSKMRYVGKMLKFNSDMRFLPYVLRTCTRKKGSKSVQCLRYQKVGSISKERSILYFELSHMDEEEGATLRIIPEFVGTNCFTMSASVEGAVENIPRHWVIPSVPCPHSFYGRSMMCPKHMDLYNDARTGLKWRDHVRVKGGFHKRLAPPPEASADELDLEIENEDVYKLEDLHRVAEYVCKAKAFVLTGEEAVVG